MGADRLRTATGKSTVKLFAAFTALETVRFCFMRLCFNTMEQTNLMDFESAIFILFCFAMMSGMVAVPLLLDKMRLFEVPKRLSGAVRALLVGTAAGAVASCYTSGYLALACQFITTFCLAGALAVCLRRVAGGLIPPRCVGRFVGLSFAVMAVLGAMIFFLPFVELSTEAALIVIGVFLAVAALSFEPKNPEPATDRENSAALSSYTPPAPRFRRLALSVLCLYVLVGGLLDNIFFFDDAFAAIPNIMLPLLLYAALIDVVTGLLFERINAAVGIIYAFAFICVGQSMSFFSNHALLAYPYVIFSNAGNYMMEIYLVALPVLYCVTSNRKPGILPGLGYLLLYSGFFLTSIFFEFIPESAYSRILGVALLVSVAAIALTAYLMNEGKAMQLKRMETALKERIDAAFQDRKATPLPVENLFASYGFTDREAEVMRHLIDGKTTMEIAETMGIAKKSVQNYISSMLSKTNMKSRLEMIMHFSRANS